MEHKITKQVIAFKGELTIKKSSISGAQKLAFRCGTQIRPIDRLFRGVVELDKPVVITIEQLEEPQGD